MDAPFGTEGARARASKNTTLLVTVIVVLVIIAVAIYALFGERAGGGGGGGHPSDPCRSLQMPALAPGLECISGDAGQYAWLTAEDAGASGVAPPPHMSRAKQWVASDSSCVTESYCQGQCLGDPSCKFYTYDSSKLVPTKNCPVTGSVCTTYAGALPAKIAAGKVPAVTGGIPAAYLPAPPGRRERLDPPWYVPTPLARGTRAAPPYRAFDC